MSSPPPPEYGAVTEPIPVLTHRPTWRESFAALEVFNYRLWLSALALGSTGSWMARVAIDWLVLELTRDVAMVGLTVAIQFSPTLLLGVWAGVISDRVSRRMVLLTTQTVATVANATLAVLVLTGIAAIWQVFLIAGITGIAQALEGPSRSAFVSEMVGTQRLRGAISLNATTFHLGGLLGPALSGVLIVALGSGVSLAVNAGTTACSVLAMSLMRAHELIPAPKQRRRGGHIREAVKYAFAKPAIRWSLVLLSAVSIFGMNLPVLLTAAAGNMWGTGAAGYGLYNSLCAAGAFLGAFFSARRRALRLRDVVVFTGLYGLMTALGATEWYAIFLAALIGLGLMRLLFAMSAEALTQLSTNPGIRGRVMSLYIMVLTGGQAAGGVIMGWVAQNLGGTWAFLIAGGVPVLVALVVAFLVARNQRLRLQIDLRSRSFLRIVSLENG